MADLNRIVDIYRKEDNNYINANSLESVKTAALYMYYHYYNADVTKLDDLNGQICFLTGDMGDIVAMVYNQEDDNTIDMITVIPAEKFDNVVFIHEFPEYLNKINTNVANVVLKNYNSVNNEHIRLLNEFDTDDDTQYRVLILSNAMVSPENRIKFQELAAKHRVKNGKIRIDMLFGDDISEEVDDVESPKVSVDFGSLKLMNNTIAYFGEEKSLLTFISAKSLRDCFYLYGTKGLFASNLRYYVKSAKIDSQIEKTIAEEPENFCYYNNGIIITCKDYNIVGDELQLIDFSIVNGGQTTNIIGRTSFTEDFPIMCKLIKNKYSTLEENIDFLSKVAEASNTQKPIKAKDLIANRKEQRLLKIQFEEAGMFLQIKRGEKILKERYPQPWQNAANDQIAQMLYSVVYQMPGSAKNSKSKLLENEKIYQKIFCSRYDSNFFISLQHLKVAFNNWVKCVKKIEKNGNTKLGLAKNGDLITPAVMGLMYKIAASNELLEKIKNINISEVNSENDDFKLLISQNDIGSLPLFYSLDMFSPGFNKKMHVVFEALYDLILIPSYNAFRKKYPTYAYGNFVKSDMYYYNYVVPTVIKYFKNGCEGYDIMQVFDLSKPSEFSEVKIKETSNPGLQFELEAYRKKKASIEGIEVYNVITRMNIANIVKNRPKDTFVLAALAKMKESQVVKYGKDICDIVRKYSKIDDYVKDKE